MRSLQRELFHKWNNGNYHSAVREVNTLIKRIEDKMSRAGNKMKTSNTNDNFFYVNCPVEEEAFGDIINIYDDIDAVLERLVLFIQTGYKVGFSLASDGELTVCAVTDKREGSETKGGCLTASADGWYDAFRVLLYKHDVLLQGDWGAAPVPGSERRRIR